MQDTHSNILGAKVTRIYWERVPDSDPDLSYLEQDYNDPSIPAAEAAKYREQDAERLKAYGVDWWCEGVRAVAEIEIPTTQGGWAMRDRIVSPGLWGIESDSGDDYFAEVAQDELAQLRDILVDGYRFPADELPESDA